MAEPTQEKQVTKRNIANQISSKYEGVDSDFALKMVEETFEIIIKSLEEGKICAIREFGRFYTYETKASVKKSPLVGDQPLHIPAHQRIKFKPGAKLKKIMLDSKEKALKKSKTKTKKNKE